MALPLRKSEANQTPPFQIIGPRPVAPPARPPHGASARDRVDLSAAARQWVAVPSHGLTMGARGEAVTELQKSLLQWMPGWKDRLAVDGFYGKRTRKAVEFFKRTYGLGRDGGAVDTKTQRYLQEIRDGSFWIGGAHGPGRHPRLPGMERRYQKALRTGYPFDEPAQGGATGLAPDAIRRLAAEDPHRMIRYKGFRGQAITFKRYLELEKAVARTFPGYHAAITCTTDGVHSSSAHAEGRAIDLVLERDADGYRPDRGEFDTAALAALAPKNGFVPYDEYVHPSTYKSGPHLHVESH